MGPRAFVLLLAVLLAGCSGAVGTSTPSASPSASAGVSLQAATPSATAASSPSVGPSPVPGSPAVSIAPPGFAVGAGLVTITDGLRVRSKPEVSDASMKFEPTLPMNTGLGVLGGPVADSGYWWYRVRLPAGVTLYGGTHEGWVAAGARDGTPWLGYADVDPGRPLPSPVTGWSTLRRGDIVMTGEIASSDERGDLVVDVLIVGLLPGSTTDLAAVGTFDAAWECFDPSATPGPPEPTSSAFEGGLDPFIPPSEDLGSTRVQRQRRQRTWR